MTTAATLAAEMTVDQTQYQAGLAEAKQAASDFALQVSDKMLSVGKNLQDVGGKMTLFVTAPIVGGMAASAAAADKLDDAIYRTNTIFEDAGASVTSWSTGAATSMGMSQRAALETASEFGAMFDGMGMGSQQAADMSTSLTQLSADMASFTGSSPAEMLSELQSGMAGRGAALLKQFGIDLSTDAVKAKALAMGLGDASGALSDAEIVTARYAIIMESTSKIQGDFANRATDMGNQMQTSKAKIEDIGAKIGEKLVPVIEKALPIIDKLLDVFLNMPPEVTTAILAILGLVAAAGPIITVIGTIISLAGTIGGIISTIGASSGAITAVLTTIGATIGAALAPILPIILVVIAVIAVLIGWLYLVYTAWTNNWFGIRDAVMPVIDALANLISAILGKAVEACAGLWQNILLPALTAVWDFITSNVNPILQGLADLVEKTVGPKIQWFKDNVLAPLSGVFDSISSAISTAIGWVNSLADKIRNFELPSWLTPGSPTPFEMGIRGIGDAFKQVARRDFPAFAFEMSAAGSYPGGQYPQRQTSNSWFQGANINIGRGAPADAYQNAKQFLRVTGDLARRQRNSGAFMED